MNNNLNYLAFMALARFYDCGYSKIEGTDLEQYYSHCMRELIESGSLQPAEPLRTIDIETDAGEFPCGIYRSSSGEMVYMTGDGPFTPSDKSRRQYLFDPVKMMSKVNQILSLTGVVQPVSEDVYYLGIMLVGRKEHEIYWSRRLTPARIKQLDLALKDRSLNVPATVLCLHSPRDQSLTSNVQCLSLDVLWNPGRQLDAKRFQRCVIQNFHPAIAADGPFVWLPDTSTFVFPDQRTFTFSALQATTVIDFLVERWHTDRPWIDEQHLLRDLLIGCDSRYIKDLMKRTEGWQHVVWIKSGSCRLRVQLPGESHGDCPPWVKRTKASIASTGSKKGLTPLS